MSLAKRNSEAAKAWAAKRRESKERAILLDNKSSSRALRPPVCPEAAMKPPSHAASTSDVDNAKYMENFRAGMSNVYLGLHPQVKDRDLLRPKDQDRGRYLVSNDRRCNARGGASGTIQQEAGPDCTGRASGRIGKRRPERHGPHAENVQRKILLSEEVRSDATGGGVASGWYRGPQDPAGQVGRQGCHQSRTSRTILFGALGYDAAMLCYVPPPRLRVRRCFPSLDIVQPTPGLQP